MPWAPSRLDLIAEVYVSDTPPSQPDQDKLAEAVDAETARTGIYIASKTRHADRWRFLRDKFAFPINSTWIDEAGPGESADLNDLWHRCIREASTAAVLIVYRERDDVLKGGWIEVGAALASGVPVLAVGIEEFSVAKHDGIRRFRHMRDAVGVLADGCMCCSV